MRPTPSLCMTSSITSGKPVCSIEHGSSLSNLLDRQHSCQRRAGRSEAKGVSTDSVPRLLLVNVDQRISRATESGKPRRHRPFSPTSGLGLPQACLYIVFGSLPSFSHNACVGHYLWPWFQRGASSLSLSFSEKHFPSRFPEPFSSSVQRACQQRAGRGQARARPPGRPDLDEHRASPGVRPGVHPHGGPEQVGARVCGCPRGAPHQAGGQDHAAPRHLPVRGGAAGDPIRSAAAGCTCMNDREMDDLLQDRLWLPVSWDAVVLVSSKDRKRW
jgi:hypothetical protein